MLQAERMTSNRMVFLLLILFFVLLLINLGSWGVIETSEARYAEISREMMLSGDWLHPRLLGIQHFHKPPVTYIISAIGMKIFGANAFGARFFLQVSLVLQALMVYLIGLNLFREKRPAILAMIVYITIPAVLVSARNLTTDSFLTTFELAAIWTWLQYKRSFRVSWLYGFYVLLALAFLTKGPVGLIFPVLVCLAYRTEKGPSRKTGHIILALLVCLALSISWYVYLMAQDKQFVNYFILKHTVERVANAETFGRSKPWWFYLVLVPVLSLPWSAWLVAQYKKIKLLPRKPVNLLLLWILVPLLFFSMSSSKLILYVLPLFAGMALLAGFLLHQATDESLKRMANGTLIFYLILNLTLLLGSILPFKVTVPAWSLILPALALVAVLYIWRKPMQNLYKIAAAALVFTAFLIPFSTILLAENPALTKSGKAMAELIESRNLQNRPVIVYDELLPSLAFHLQRNIISVYENDRDLRRETQFETDDNWKQNLLDLHDKADEMRLRTLVNENAVIVSKGEIPVEKSWLIQNFTHKEQRGKWVLYY